MSAIRIVSCISLFAFHYLRFHPCPFVWWMLVCRHDYTKSNEQISMKFGWRVSLGPEKTRLTMGVDQGTIPHSLRHSLRNARILQKKKINKSDIFGGCYLCESTI